MVYRHHSRVLPGEDAPGRSRREKTELPDHSQKKKAFASFSLVPNHQLRTAPLPPAAAASSSARIDLRTAEESRRAYLIGAAFCIWSRIIYELLLVVLV